MATDRGVAALVHRGPCNPFPEVLHVHAILRLVFLLPLLSLLPLTASGCGGPGFDGEMVTFGEGHPNHDEERAVEEALASCPTGAFRASYFNNLTLSGTAAHSRCESAVQHAWGNSAPAAGVTQNFSARWVGSFDFPGGDTEFTLRVDDGARLFVDGMLVLDAWKNQSATTYSVTRSLTAGSHVIRLDYYDHAYQAVAQLSWKTLPPACPPEQFKVEYFNNLTLSGAPAHEGCVAKIDHQWGNGSPAPGVDAEFSARWTGELDLPEGEIRFTLRVDDGARVYLGGTLILDAWKNQPATTYDVVRTVTAGRHPLRIEYYDHAYTAVAQLTWTQVGPASPVSGTSYFVDCSGGNDGNDGRSTSHPWKTLTRASSAALAPGDGLFLKRGCTWNGTFTVPFTGTQHEPIFIGAFGTGARPRIWNAGSTGAVVRITGSWLVLDNLEASAAPPPDSRPDCPTGWRIGFAFASGGHNTLQNSRAHGLTAGVQVGSGSSHNRVLRNELINNVNMSRNTQGGDDDSGSWGILINGDDNEIAWNHFSGNNSFCSYDYGQEGASVEVYAAQRNRVHHNVSIGDTTFTELGSSSTKIAQDNVYAYNLYVNTEHENTEFLVVRGGGSFGPNPGTVAYNNTVYLTGSDSQGVVCMQCSPSMLTLRNNILWVNWKTLYAGAAFNESNNLYWRTGGNPLVQLFNTTLSASSKKTDPLFVNAAAGDFRLRIGSPALDAGHGGAVAAGFTADLDGTTVPQQGTPDIGAFERQ